MTGATTGGVTLVLRLEGALVLLICLFAYAELGAGWPTFAWFFLAPDIALLGYLAGPRIGAAAYNSAHSYIGALATFAVGVSVGSATTVVAGLIWASHISFDRMLGYGLKYSAGAGFTHLGRIGRA